MKGCLKHSAHGFPSSPCISPAPSSSSSSSTHDGLCDPSTISSSGLNTPPTTRSRKCVDFGKEICAQFFVADEWDRTPTEPARKLTYQDLLELKEIQRSLPHANQPADHLAGRAAKCYLRSVPIGLLPLLPDSNPSTPTIPTPMSTPTGEPARNPLSASSSPAGSGASSPMRDASPERSSSTSGNANSTATSDSPTNPPWCVNFHRVRAPPPPVAPAYAPSALEPADILDSAPALSSSLGGGRFARFHAYPPSPLHRGATPPRSGQVQDKHLAHLPPPRQAPPRARPKFAFLPLLGDTAEPAVHPETVEEKKEDVKEKRKKEETAPATTVLSSTRDSSREREEDAGTQVEPEWPRHVYGSSSKAKSPTSPTTVKAPASSSSFKRPALSDAGRYHGGFGGGYSGYVPPPPVRMVAASGLGVPIKTSLTANAGASPVLPGAQVKSAAAEKDQNPDTDAKKDTLDVVADEGAWYASHAHPYSPGSSRTGSVAGSRSASVERGGERERRLYAPQAAFAAALLRVDELVQRVVVDDDADGEEGDELASDGGDADADAGGDKVRVDDDEERGGRSETKGPKKTTPARKARKAKKEKRFIMVNDMQIELDGSDAEDDEDADEDGDGEIDSRNNDVEHADAGMSLKAAMEVPATPPTVYACQLPTPTPTPPPVLSGVTPTSPSTSIASTATATPTLVRSPVKTPTPAASTPASCLLGETAGPVAGAGSDVDPARATTPTPINVMAPIRFKRAVPSQVQKSY